MNETNEMRRRFGVHRTWAEEAALLAAELERLKRELAAMEAKKIVLFGSYARGRADALTDLDLPVYGKR